MQGLRAEVTWPRDILILMSVNSPGPKDLSSLDMSCQMWAGTSWDTSCFTVHHQLRYHVVKIPSHRAQRRLLQSTLNNSLRCKGCLCFLKDTCLWEAGQRELGKQLPSQSSNSDNKPTHFQEGANSPYEQQPLSSGWLKAAAGLFHCLKSTHPWEQRFTAPSWLTCQSNSLLEIMQNCFNRIIWSSCNLKVVFLISCST